MCHASGGLIKQDQDGVASGNHGQFNPLPLAMRKPAHQAIGTLQQVEPCETSLHRLVDIMSPTMAASSDPDILTCRKAVKHARDLRLNANSKSSNVVRISPGDVEVAKHDASAAWPI